MALVAQTTEQRQAVLAKLNGIIESGKSRVAAGLTALQDEFQIRRDLRVRPKALDVVVHDDGTWAPVIVEKKNRHELVTTPHARTQLLDRAGVDSRFVATLDKHHLGELLRTNLRTLLPLESPDGLLVRTVKDTAKAFLSPAYRPLDNALFFDSFVTQAVAANMVPYRGEVTDTRAFVSFVRPQVVEITPGEYVVVGLELRGSDYGRGAQELNAMFVRLICLNGAVGFDFFRKIHIGRRFSAEDFGDAEVITLSQKTIELDAETVRSALNDTMQGVTHQLDALTETLRDAAAGQTVNVDEKLTVLKKKGLKAETLKKAKALYENEALPVEALPPAQGAWRLSNALSLMANNAQGDEAADLRDAAFAVLGLKA